MIDLNRLIASIPNELRGKLSYYELRKIVTNYNTEHVEVEPELSKDDIISSIDLTLALVREI